MARGLGLGAQGTHQLDSSRVKGVGGEVICRAASRASIEGEGLKGREVIGGIRSTAVASKGSGVKSSAGRVRVGCGKARLHGVGRGISSTAMASKGSGVKSSAGGEGWVGFGKIH